MIEILFAAVAVTVAVGGYWGEDELPLSYVKAPLVNWLYGRGPTVDGWPLEGEETVLQNIGHGLNCGVCTGQWVSFVLAWAWLGYSPLNDPIGFLVVSVLVNSLNWAFGWAKEHQLLPAD